MNDYRNPGEKENEVLLVRLTKSQKLRLRSLSEANGFKSMSDYVRIQLLNPSIEAKLNQILALVEATKSQEKKK